MRKRIVTADREGVPPSGEQWLDLDALVEVEITSEDPAHPIESALVTADGAGWRAADPGEQTVRLLFAQPTALHRIWLDFVEPGATRTQEFLLRWSADGGKTYRDVMRQQWNFSPDGGTRETEDRRVELTGVTVLELSIVPDISGGDARASLACLRLA